MKILNYILILCLLSCNTKTTSKDDCFPDKGIKTAMIYATSKDTGNPFSNEVQDDVVKVTFDTLGRPLKAISTIQEMESQYIYKKGKLLFVLIKSELPGFYNVNDIDAIRNSFPKTIDTTIVTHWDSQKRATEVITSDGYRSVTEYINCEEEIRSDYDTNGNLFNRHKVIKQNGKKVKTVWTSIRPIQNSRTSNYYDYKLNRKGHWIERKFKHQDREVITETRELTYY